MRGGQATAEGRRYRGLVGLLTAEGIGLAGTRLSMIAIPWFVITTTGSAVLTGVVAFAEAAPYVVAKALGGPLIDRLGARRVAVAGDLAGMAAVAAIPLLYAAGVLELPVLLALVALLGLCRGPADGAKKTLIPDVVTRARVPMERATGLSGTLERLASTVGAAAGGAVVAAVGPLTALVVNAATFALAPAIVRLTVPVRRAGVADGGGYLAQLRGGVAFLRRERLLRSLAGMIAVTNLLEAAMFSVLLPVWAHSTGHGPVMVGVLAGSSAAAAIGSSLLASMLAHRLPRRATYLVSFLVAGGAAVRGAGAGRAAAGDRGGVGRRRARAGVPQPDHLGGHLRADPARPARPGPVADHVTGLGGDTGRAAGGGCADRSGGLVAGAGVLRPGLPGRDHPARAAAGVGADEPAAGVQWGGSSARRSRSCVTGFCHSGRLSASHGDSSRRARVS